MLTKSGGNDYHGTLFEFLRNDKLDAKNYAFTTARPPKDPFKWNQYGFTMGGPVRIPKLFNGKDRLFFMANYEAFRQRRQVQATYTVPTADMQGGNFSGIANLIYDPASRVKNADGTVTATPFANNTIPSARIDPTSKKLLEFYPAANLITSRLSNNFQKSAGRPINKDQFILRMDFQESSKSSWFGRYSWGDENQLTEGLAPGRFVHFDQCGAVRGLQHPHPLAHRGHRDPLRLHPLLQLRRTPARLQPQRGR